MSILLKFNDNIVLEYNHNLKSRLIEDFIKNDEQLADITGNKTYNIDYNSKYMKNLETIYLTITKSINKYKKVNIYNFSDYENIIDFAVFLRIDSNIVDAILFMYENMCKSIIPTEYKHKYNIVFKEIYQHDYCNEKILHDYTTHNYNQIIRFTNNGIIHKIFTTFMKYDNYNIISYCNKLNKNMDNKIDAIEYFTRSIEISVKIDQLNNDNRYNIYSITDMIDKTILKDSYKIKLNILNVINIYDIVTNIDIINIINIINILHNSSLSYVNDYLINICDYYNIHFGQKPELMFNSILTSRETYEFGIFINKDDFNVIVTFLTVILNDNQYMSNRKICITEI